MPDAPERVPIPLGVIAETGATHPPLPPGVLPGIPRASDATYAKGAPAPPRARALALEGAVDDPMELSQAGWCALFASDADPAIKEALQPLLALRRGQVGDDRFFKIFEGTAGVRPGQTAANWAAA